VLTKHLLRYVWLATVILLLLIFTPFAGSDAYGASRWISIAGFTLQPSEFAKITIILTARVRVVLRRRAREAASASTFENGDLTIDYSAGTASLAGEELRLTAMEYQLLCLLARNVGKVLTHGYILREVWNSTSDGDRASLRVFMASLRKKIEADQSNPRYIQTQVGVGYRMVRV